MKPYWKTTKPRMLCLSIAAAVAWAGILAPLIAEEPECLAAERWVETHASNLPDSLEEISSFPHLYRAKIFGELQPDVKSQLWREHLRTALAQHPEWTPQQATLVSQAIQMLSPQLYALPEGAPEREQAGERIDALWQGALRLFSSQQAEALLVRLGSPQPTYQTVSSWPVLLRSKVRQSLSVTAQQVIGINQPCKCKTWVERPCPNLEWCLEGCRLAWCGPGLFDICDGICVATAPGDPLAVILGQ
ncbi:MAG: bacteriocin fulvocin C-related protein [Acidobacteriota bacterium]